MAGQVGQGFNYTHINANTTTTIAASVGVAGASPQGSGLLANICINNPGSAWTATVYDSATGSGTVIAVISFSSAFSLAYNIAYKNGLTIVTSGTTPGDLTVSWL